MNSLLDTYRLRLINWLIVLGTSGTIGPVLEAAKWMERRGWLGAMK